MHHVWRRCCADLKKAKDVNVGDTVWLAAAAAAAATPAVVRKVGSAAGVGLHNPLMKHGEATYCGGLLTTTLPIYLYLYLHRPYLYPIPTPIPLYLYYCRRRTVCLSPCGTGGFPVADGVVTAFDRLGLVKLASAALPMTEARRLRGHTRHRLPHTPTTLPHSHTRVPHLASLAAHC